MKIAILHEMLIKLGGAEKVVENWMRLFPEAHLYTLIYDENKVSNIFPKNIIHKSVFKLKTQNVYNLFKKQRLCFPYMSKSVESLDFSEYDVVLCSSSGFAHGAITKPETKFIVYYHSPARYMWDWTNEYKRDLGLNSGWKKYLVRPFLNSQFYKLRQWDYIASNRVDISLANSQNTQNRIQKYYKKDSIIVYPPVETNRFQKNIEEKYDIPFKENDYYIIISALTEFKKIEIAIEGFNYTKKSNLIIIGLGDYREVLENKVVGNNIKFVGGKFGDELVYIVQNSLGLIFPGEEDFGIVPIEAMAAGKAIFAYKGGGLLETIKEGITGEFFSDKNGKDFIEKFLIFDNNNKSGKYIAENCLEQAKKYDKNIFEEKILEIIKSK